MSQTDDEGEQSVISDQHEQKTEKILNIWDGAETEPEKIQSAVSSCECLHNYTSIWRKKLLQGVVLTEPSLYLTDSGELRDRLQRSRTFSWS